MQKDYFVAEYNYLTPFYSPCVSTGCTPEASHFGQFLPDWWWLPYAALSLPFLLLFRLTCYYYRKAYYRAFWLSPPACAVAEPHTKYTGETRFPLLGQNLHRYFFYAAVVISLINTYDAIKAFQTADHELGFGRLNHFSKHPVRYKLWGWVSKLNTKHMELAWFTLGTLALTDFYVMAVSAGWISDLRFIN